MTHYDKVGLSLDPGPSGCKAKQDCDKTYGTALYDRYKMEMIYTKSRLKGQDSPELGTETKRKKND